MVDEVAEPVASEKPVKKRRAARKSKGGVEAPQKTLVAVLTTGTVALVEWWLAARFGIRLF